jgi:flavin reductase (DIM6/NTAB) family NADH-FMN oxidoreductase RutF
VIGARSGEERNLMTANWVTQLALEPKLVGVSIERHARTHALVAAGRSFCVSVMAREERTVIRRFVKPAELDESARTLAGVAYADAPVSGSPFVASAIAYVDCAVRESLDCGSHTLFVGEVLDVGFAGAPEGAEVLRMEDTRMSYGG